MYDNLDKETLLKNIMSLDFSINDLSLYLDTHPDDRNALSKHLNFCYGNGIVYRMHGKQY